MVRNALSRQDEVVFPLTLGCGHSATCGLVVGILYRKVSEFWFGGLISASSKLSARELSQITSLQSI